MLYYIIVNGQQMGPMPKEQLVKYGLNPGSKVWAEGMPNWVDAATVADLRSVLYPQQPPIPQQQTPYQGGGYQQAPNYGGQSGAGTPPYGQSSYNQQYNNCGQPQEVSFGDAIKICFNKYADFEGRARRSEFWWWQLFVFLAGLVVGSLTCGLGYLAVLIPTYAVGARRLHDTGRSGWWQLLSLTFVGSIILIVWWCEDSHRDNEYGPSPKYPNRY